VALFVLDEAIGSSGYLTANKAAFLCAALSELDEQLRRRGAQLVVRRGRVEEVLGALVSQLSVDEVHLASDVSGYARRREVALRTRLTPLGCALHVHSASVTVHEPGELTPLAGADHFAVFTPFYRKWSRVPLRPVVAAPARLNTVAVVGEPLPDPAELFSGMRSPQLRVGGEMTGRALADDWLAGPIDEYADRHDDLAADATSRLSPYLHFGCLSPVELVTAAGARTAGREAFVRQLAWRDFHHQVLAARPAAAREDYRSYGARARRDRDLFSAWRDGRTGYPIVDAGMRQLAAEGWMHNRARLITASFLTKTLGQDWRLGADHFMQLLVDADVANNQLNWQWVAGTGTDTRPYRVLNPMRQAERYDPAGEYVRRWIPELAHLEGPAVHTPWQCPGAPHYPARIIDHTDAVGSRGGNGDAPADPPRNFANRRAVPAPRTLR
ncbi:MAG: deoxyribodipyrimidine photo-lyase, partial [Mycobacteriaceae bacterium]|nr:deoxyribodipyrimidine photo-lyase [Mycobacteriaceae bacterium]